MEKKHRCFSHVIFFSDPFFFEETHGKNDRMKSLEKWDGDENVRDFLLQCCCLFLGGKGRVLWRWHVTCENLDGGRVHVGRWFSAEDT